MAGKSYSYEYDLLRLIFQGNAIANVADNAATSPVTNLWVALHTDDPSVLTTFNCTISGTVMTASAPTAGVIRVGQILYIAGQTTLPTITSLGTGTGGAGTYNLSTTITGVTTSTAVTAEGTAATLETTYGAYARVAVARSASGWTVTGNVVQPVANIQFPTATTGTETLKFFSITTALSGASKILYSGPITPNVGMAVNVTPRITTSSTITET